ncbi:MAG: MATE family efflux transporter [Hyphomonadaceae bacterium]|nr:MATE family efflux transporter [Hyphomonadaceae bacterium]
MGDIMRDMTEGPIAGHLMGMAAFIAVSIVVQTLYYLVDLYFVAQLGPAAIAGVSAAGTVFFLALAVAQIIGVGGVALLAQAAGRKDSGDAQTTFDQVMSMALALAALTLVLGYGFADRAIGLVTADAETAAQARSYLHAYLPSLALIFPATALGAALRAAGVVRAPTMIQMGSVLVNALFAPPLITGWGTGLPLGVAGAGLASSIAGAFGCIAMAAAFARVQKFVHLHPRRWAPNFPAWGRITAVGLPSAGEFLIMFIVGAMMYWAIRPFGAEAQAGYGVGARVMQAILLPAMAIAFAAAPIAGQNFGAGKLDRVRETFRTAALYGSSVMVALTLFCQIRPEALVRPFAEDARTLATAAEFMRVLSWNFVATGLVFTCSSIFQGLGDTRPSFIASVVRLASFLGPALWLSQQPHTQLHDYWRVSVVCVLLQCAVCLAFLARMLRRKLGQAATASA